MSANPQDERTFYVQKIFGGFRRKATNGSGFGQARGSADWERRLAADGKPSHSIRRFKVIYFNMF